MCDGKIILHYMKARGRAEAIRLMFKYAKKEFVDNRMDKETDWPAFKPKTPFGQVPVLEFTDKDGKTCMLTQSHTITRCVARLLCLNGKSLETKARADEGYELLREVVDQFVKIILEQDPECAKKLKEAMKNEIIPKNFGFLEKRAKELGGKSVASKDELVYPDFVLAAMIEAMQMQDKECAAKLQESYPTLFCIKKSIYENPEIKTYLASRPVTAM